MDYTAAEVDDDAAGRFCSTAVLSSRSVSYDVVPPSSCMRMRVSQEGSWVRERAAVVKSQLTNAERQRGSR